MAIKQISVFVENKKGALKELLGILAEAKIDLRAISIGDTSDFGILRMIVPDPGLVMDVFKKSGITAQKTDVIGCRLPDRPGALHKVLSALCDAGISVEYLYSMLCSRDAHIILRVDDNELAQKVLVDAGHTLTAPGDYLYG
jgi:hypothetical protein